MFCTNADVRRYVPNVDETLAERARWIADWWILDYAPSLSFAQTVPEPAHEASALLAATLLSEEHVEWPIPTPFPQERVPNMVRLMLVPWSVG